MALHWLDSLRVTVSPFDRVTVRLSGRLPSWLFASTQTFLTVASVVSGVWVFLTVKPCVASPVTSHL